MCKPPVRHLEVTANGPCWFTARTHSDACAAFSLGISWRQSVANVLRRWADAAEGVTSFVVVGHAPPQIEMNDVTDALSVGLNESNQYLNDLWRDRTVGLTEVGPVLPSRAIVSE